MFGDLPRKAPSALSCIKCGATVGTVQLPDLDKAPLLLRRGIMAMGAALDTDVGAQLFTPRAFAETGALLCEKCSNG